MLRPPNSFVCGRAWRDPDTRTFTCRRCGAAGLDEQRTAASAMFALDTGAPVVLPPEAGVIAETLARLADNPPGDTDKALLHVHLDGALASRILEAASQPRWDHVRAAGRDVVPIEIDPEALGDVAGVVDRVCAVAAALVAPGTRPWLILIAALGALLPAPPPTDPDHVLAWLGYGEGGAMVLLPDGTVAGLDELDAHIRRQL